MNGDTSAAEQLLAERANAVGAVVPLHDDDRWRQGYRAWHLVPPGDAMKLVIEARLEDDASATSADPPVMLAVIERKDHDLTDFGLSPAEGRQLLAAAQSAPVVATATGNVDSHRPHRTGDHVNPTVF